MPEGLDAAAAHVQLRMPGGFSLELDTAESARLWHAGWRADAAGVRVVIGFSLPAWEAVDERYAELTSAGYVVRQPPFDAFWGARWAIVADPDGNDIGLMSPVDESRRTWPPEQSPVPEKPPANTAAQPICAHRQQPVTRDSLAAPNLPFGSGIAGCPGNRAAVPNGGSAPGPS